jgi:hypothetical protein
MLSPLLRVKLKRCDQTGSKILAFVGNLLQVTPQKSQLKAILP